MPKKQAPQKRKRPAAPAAPRKRPRRMPPVMLNAPAPQPKEMDPIDSALPSMALGTKDQVKFTKLVIYENSRKGSKPITFRPTASFQWDTKILTMRMHHSRYPIKLDKTLLDLKFYVADKNNNGAIVRNYNTNSQLVVDPMAGVFMIKKMRIFLNNKEIVDGRNTTWNACLRVMLLNNKHN